MEDHSIHSIHPILEHLFFHLIWDDLSFHPDLHNLFCFHLILEYPSFPPILEHPTFPLIWATHFIDFILEFPSFHLILEYLPDFLIYFIHPINLILFNLSLYLFQS